MHCVHLLGKGCLVKDPATLFPHLDISLGHGSLYVSMARLYAGPPGVTITMT